MPARPRTAAAEIEPVTPAPGTPLRVLLVDDSVVNQRIASLMLERAGYRVTIAPGGREALERIDEEAFDLVLMDVEMPNLDGPAATVLLRKGGHGALPVVALTAHTELRERERCLTAGMDDLLVKPFRSVELVEVVERWARTDRALAAATEGTP